MSTTTPRALRADPARPSPHTQDPRRLASRVKRLSFAITVAGFGLAWGLVSQNVVGATNAAPPAGSAQTSRTPGKAALPSTDFFGRPATQPQPILGAGGSGSGGGPVVRGRTS